MSSKQPTDFPGNWWAFGRDPNPHIDLHLRVAWQRGFNGEPAPGLENSNAYKKGQMAAKSMTEMHSKHKQEEI